MEKQPTVMELGQIPSQPEQFQGRCRRSWRKDHHRSILANVWTHIFLNFLLIGLFIGFVYFYYLPTLNQSNNDGNSQEKSTYLERVNQEWNELRTSSVYMAKSVEHRLASMEDDLEKLEEKLDSRSREGFQILEKLGQSVKSGIPIGFVYFQLPNQAEPSVLWPWANWTQITIQYAGHFFRAEGGSSEPFGHSQLDAFQGHSHSFWVKKGNAAQGNTSNTYGDSIKSSLKVIRGPTSDGANGSARVADETRPLNYAIRIWQRIQ